MGNRNENAIISILFGGLANLEFYDHDCTITSHFTYQRWSFSSHREQRQKGD